MIVSIRGTNGAGKSTLVRKVMDDCVRDGGIVATIRYPAKENKRKPMGYVCFNPERKAIPFFIIGHYEIPNGGIDTMPSLKYAYELALGHHELGMHILMEGKNFTEPLTWFLEQHQRKMDIRVVLIDIPLSECVAAVRERGHTIKEETITTLHAKSRMQFDAFKEAGIRAFKGSRQQCLDEVQSWLS